MPLLAELTELGWFTTRPFNGNGTGIAFRIGCKAVPSKRKLLETSASLLVTGATLLGTRSY